MKQGAALETDLLRLPEVSYHGEVIGKIAGSRCYVSGSIRVSRAADLFNNNPELLALGVVDEHGEAVGIIERRSLLGRLSMQYGRDVYKNRKLSAILETVPVFDHQRNIFSLAEQLQDELHAKSTTFYLLTQSGRRFAGIFSTRDLLIYLSDITRKDIALARLLQERMRTVNAVTGESRIGFACDTRMAKGVGGDFTFIRRTGDDSWFFCLADVSGKGVAASLITAILDGICNTFDYGKGVPNLVEGLNQYIVERFEGEKYLTGLFAEYDTGTGVLSLNDMGHSMVYLLRDGRFFRIRTSPNNWPVGLVPGAVCTTDSVRLAQGDVLVVLSDGIPEQINESGEMFGTGRAASLIRKGLEGGIAGIPESLFGAVESFRGGQPQHDDMSVLLVEIL